MRNRLRGWLKALKGFYDPEDPESGQDFVARFLFSARGIILVISAQAAIIAGLLAFIQSAFNALYFVLVFVGFVTIHAVSNLSNDYFGYTRGHDTADSPRRRYTLHPLADGILTKKQMQLSIVALLSVVVAISAYLTLVRGIIVVYLTLLGMLMLFFYDAAPKPLKEIGLGEVASFVVWGPLMVFGGYYVIAGTLSLTALLFSVPYGLGVMTILTGKHIDQETYDKEKGIETLPVILGERRARTITIACIGLMYVFPFVPVMYGRIPVVGAILLLNYGRASEAVRVLNSDRPTDPPKGYVGWPLWYHRQCLVHNRRFGWLYIGAFLVVAILVRLDLAGLSSVLL